MPRASSSSRTGSNFTLSGLYLNLCYLAYRRDFPGSSFVASSMIWERSAGLRALL